MTERLVWGKRLYAAADGEVWEVLPLGGRPEQRTYVASRPALQPKRCWGVRHRYFSRPALQPKRCWGVRHRYFSRPEWAERINDGSPLVGRYRAWQCDRCGKGYLQLPHGVF